MMLLSAYGDALGANHENQRVIYSAPLPTRLPGQTLVDAPHRWGYWISQRQWTGPAIGITTDDTAIKLFILHPWLQQTLNSDAELHERSFREFIDDLKRTELIPEWLAAPRNAQIESWQAMYRAAENSPTTEEFFVPDIPTVFGLFLFLELAVIRTGYSAIENYRFFRDASILDQGYAKAVTGFLTAITSLAFSMPPVDRLDDWLPRQSYRLVDELISANIDNREIATIGRLIDTMTDLGSSLTSQTPHQFMVEFERLVVQADRPPFMGQAFQRPLFDPMRMLAEIYAAVAYAKSDPFRSLQPLAFGSGDSDTVCAFLGTMMGIAAGEQRLRGNKILATDMTIVENVLRDRFQVDLNQHVDLFLRLRGESALENEFIV